MYCTDTARVSKIERNYLRRRTVREDCNFKILIRMSEFDLCTRFITLWVHRRSDIVFHFVLVYLHYNNTRTYNLFFLFYKTL